MTPKRPRGSRITLDWQERGRLRHELFSMYLADQDFMGEISRIIENHGHVLDGAPQRFALVGHPRYSEAMESTEVSTYIDSVGRLVTESGLWRLLDHARNPETDGAEWVHRRCRAIRGGRDPRSAVVWVGREPQIGPEVTAVGASVIHVDISSEWDPRSERRSDARARLISEATATLDDALDRAAQAAVERGYVFVDTRPNEARDLAMLFRAMRGDTIDSIRDGADVDTVATVVTALSRLAKRMDVDAAGWHSWDNPEAMYVRGTEPYYR